MNRWMKCFSLCKLLGHLKFQVFMHRHLLYYIWLSHHLTMCWYLVLSSSKYTLLPEHMIILLCDGLWGDFIAWAPYFSKFFFKLIWMKVLHNILVYFCVSNAILPFSFPYLICFQCSRFFIHIKKIHTCEN